MEDTDTRPRALIHVQDAPDLPACECGNPDHEHGIDTRFEPFAYIVVGMAAGPPEDPEPKLYLMSDCWKGQPEHITALLIALLERLEDTGAVEPALMHFFAWRGARDMRRTLEMGLGLDLDDEVEEYRTKGN